MQNGRVMGRLWPHCVGYTGQWVSTTYRLNLQELSEIPEAIGVGFPRLLCRFAHQQAPENRRCPAIVWGELPHFVSL